MNSLSLPSLTSRQSILLASVATCLATTSIILSFQALRREHRTVNLKKRVGEDVEEWEKSRAASGVGTPEEKAERWAQSARDGRGDDEDGPMYDEDLIKEQLTRNYTFLGAESMDQIRKSYVVVVGCGGVGSWCATMLLRSGVGHILLIDFDMTTLSSLNRHACATLEDVGSPKVIAMSRYLAKIAPWARIETKVSLWRSTPECQSWLEGADYVVDAIDNIATKVDLLTHCKNQGIKVFSSMGSGAKRDPTRVQIADISNTYEDPLARSVRTRLKKNGIMSGVPVVYSTEVPSDVKLLPLPEEEFQKGSVKELQAFDDFRVRILPVIGPLPAIFGLFIATFIIHDLAGKPLVDCLEVKNRKKLYSSLVVGLSEREARWQGMALQAKIGLTAEDMAYVFEDLNRGRETFPPRRILPKPCAVRWDKHRDLDADNVIIMTPANAKRHEEECLQGDKSMEEVWGQEACDAVHRLEAEARRVMAYRSG